MTNKNNSIIKSYIFEDEKIVKLRPSEAWVFNDLKEERTTESEEFFIIICNSA